MPLEIKIEQNFDAHADKWAASIMSVLSQVSGHALNNMAFEARDAVKVGMRVAFRNPKPITVNSVRVKKCDVNLPIDQQVVTVYIDDYVPGMSVSPAAYLMAQDEGGSRSNKSFERVLQSSGGLQGGQQATPAPGAPLDGFGQLRGGGLREVLSRLKAFSEMGFSANATDASFKRAMRAKAAKAARARGVTDATGLRSARAGAYMPATKQTGTDYFMPKSRLTEGAMGVFQLESKGHMKAVLWFDTRRPNYVPRFPFREIVRAFAVGNMAKHIDRAMRFVSKH